MGLEPNRKYMFRVRAENQYGVSEPLTMDDYITAKVLLILFYFLIAKKLFCPVSTYETYSICELNLECLFLKYVVKFFDLSNFFLHKMPSFSFLILSKIKFL